MLDVELQRQSRGISPAIHGAVADCLDTKYFENARDQGKGLAARMRDRLCMAVDPQPGGLIRPFQEVDSTATSHVQRMLGNVRGKTEVRTEVQPPLGALCLWFQVNCLVPGCSAGDVCCIALRAWT
jgi:hypothetical protein